MRTEDRWAALEDDLPDDIADLLDAARDVPPFTPELAEELEQSFFAALAREREERARKPVSRPAFTSRILLAGIAAATGLVTACDGASGGATRSSPDESFERADSMAGAPPYPPPPAIPRNR